MHCCRIVNVIKNKNIKNSLGATWNASHLAVRLCALRHWKQVSMPPTTQSLRHPLTRASHVAPRIKTARRFTAKNPKWNNLLVGTWYFTSAHNHSNTLNINHLLQKRIIAPLPCFFSGESVFILFIHWTPTCLTTNHIQKKHWAERGCSAQCWGLCV